jgi:hypothetical protein
MNKKEGVDFSTPFRQNQDFDGLCRRINRQVPMAQCALKLLVGIFLSQHFAYAKPASLSALLCCALENGFAALARWVRRFSSSEIY